MGFNRFAFRKEQLKILKTMLLDDIKKIKDRVVEGEDTLADFGVIPEISYQFIFRALLLLFLVMLMISLFSYVKGLCCSS